MQQKKEGFLHFIKSKKFGNIAFVVAIILSFCYLMWDARNTFELRNEIKSNGIETTGVLRHKSSATSGRSRIYGVRFSFYMNDSLIIHNSFRLSKDKYDMAVPGRKYKVKYLPDNPSRKSVIYIEQPVFDTEELRK